MTKNSNAMLASMTLGSLLTNGRLDGLAVAASNLIPKPSARATSVGQRCGNAAAKVEP